jgi:hypothetical protein
MDITTSTTYPSPFPLTLELLSALLPRGTIGRCHHLYLTFPPLLVGDDSYLESTVIVSSLCFWVWFLSWRCLCEALEDDDFLVVPCRQPLYCLVYDVLSY